MAPTSAQGSDPLDIEKGHTPRPGFAAKAGLVLGLSLFLAMLFAPAPAELSAGGWRTAAVGVLMAIWWMTEAVPIPVTALLPLVLFPLLGIEGIEGAAAPYAQPTIFLFMGGFMIAITMERWNLHKRIALAIIRYIGTEPSSIVAGFMAATAFLSMWVSNTATTLMMLPIAVSVMELARRGEPETGSTGARNFGLCLLLGVAYAASVGGIGTLVGTPGNALMAGFLSTSFGYQIEFVRWMMVGIPVVVIGIPLIHVVLTRVVYPLKGVTLSGGREFIDEERERLGPVSRPESRVAILFCSAAALWVLQPLLSGVLPGISDAGIAMFVGLLLFLLPSGARGGGALLDWKDAERLPWGVLILFGGGLSLAGAIQRTGLSTWLGGFLSAAEGLPIIVIIFIATALIILLTELTSNTATTAAFLPIMAALAIAIGENPLLLVLPVTMAASCAFMLPVATPPNAIVYGSGAITIPQMARAGLLLNFMFTFLIVLLGYVLVGSVLGVEPGVVPEWATVAE